MATVYSKRFFGGIVSCGGASFVAGPVPNLKVWVVRSIAIVISATPNGPLFISVPGQYFLWTALNTAAPESQVIQMHQVLNPGESFEIAAGGTTGAWSCAISGFELSQ